MLYQIKRISPASAARIVGLITFAVAMLAMLVAFLGILPQEAVVNAPRGYRWLLLLVPFINAIVMYVVAYLACAFYNFLAAKTGGIEMQLSSVQAGKEDSV